jgi:hypothetical protein
VLPAQVPPHPARPTTATSAPMPMETRRIVDLPLL